jgi:Protein of unknown function (DUF559)
MPEGSSRPSNANSSAELRKVLQDPQRFAELARHFIEKSSELHAAEAGDPKFADYLKIGMKLLLDENLRLVFELTESPIETIFINSLLLTFMKNDPLNLVVQHSVRNAPGQIQAFRQTRSQFKKFIAWYVDRRGSLAGIEDYLDRELESGKMEPGEHRYLRRQLVFYEYLDLENQFHLILQPRIPNIGVEGRSVRPDMLVWVPSDESVKIVVECDGFEYHNDRAAFVHDRKRDRAFKSKGYEVLRFAGAEIHADPVAASVDLAEFLWSRDRAPGAFEFEAC